MTINRRYAKQTWVVILFLSLLFPIISTATEMSINLLPAFRVVPVDSIEKKNLTGHWVAVCAQHDGSSTLVPVDLHPSVPSCQGRVSCDDSEKTINLSWTPATEALFLVQGLSIGSQKTVSSIRSQCSLGKIGDHCSLESGGMKFILTTKGKPGLSSTDPPLEFSIVLEEAGRSQVLWDFHRDGDLTIAWDDPHFSLEWAGDLDGDGRPDLIMTLAQKYTSLPTVLFLSSKANGSDLVKRVAEYKVED